MEAPAALPPTKEGIVRGRTAAAGAGFVVLAWLFGGPGGLLAGLIIAAIGVGLPVRPRVFWILSVAFMAVAPFAILVSGLPHTPAGGPTFGTVHMAAHVFVGLSLACAGWAGLSELTGSAGRRGFLSKFVALLRQRETEKEGEPVGNEPRL
jgi:hypothetical protein